MWYDYVEGDTLTVEKLEDLVEELGYEVKGRLQMYYCMPGKPMTEGGLVKITCNDNCLNMRAHVTFGHKFLQMYLDHDESFRQFDWDDVIEFPVADLPTVVSPIKPIQIIKEEALEKHKKKIQQDLLDRKIKEEAVEKMLCKFVTHVTIADDADLAEEEAAEQAAEEALAEQEPEGTNSAEEAVAEQAAEEAVANEEEDVEQGEEDGSVAYDSEGSVSDAEVNGSEQGSDYADEIVDSDYNVSDLDDDLKEETVEEPTDVHIRAKSDPVQGSDEEDLELPDSDDGAGAKYKFKSFRKEDLHDPQFKIGQVFQSPEMFRKAVREYACKNRFDIKLRVNDRKRISAKCQNHCPWNIWCSYDSRTNCMVIKSYNDEHKCSKKWKVKAFTARYLAEKYLEHFRADQGMNLRNFGRLVQKEWNMAASCSKLSRARRYALKIIHGDEEAQYNMLWDYANEVRRSNPGSTFFIQLDNESRFNRCYFSFDACKRGFLAGCRPIICFDGCHLKTKYGGVLLSAVGMDPNDCIYPVAHCIVDVEDTNT